MERMSMRERIADLGIGFDVKMSRRQAPEDFPAGSSAWDCTFTYDGRELSTPFHMGPALCREPSAAEVLSTLAADSAGYDNARSFEEWASEYGYDADSRKSESVYREIGKQRDELSAFLGDAYDVVVYQTESE